jgi:single-stranded DNA-binding protein
MNTTDAPAITLTGYLGKDREVKTTATRTEIRTYTEYNPVIDGEEEREVEITRGGREYLLLNLASHRGKDENRTTTWHTLVVWNPERLSGTRLARKGDCVTVTGRPETYRYTDGNGEERTLHRFVVETFRFKSLKASKIP